MAITSPNTKSFKNHVSWFGLVLMLIVLSWTFYSVIDICHEMEHDVCKDEYNLQRCSSWGDLTNALTQLLIGVSLFFIVLNPLSYNLRKNYGRAIFLLPVFLTFTGFAMYAMFHAGRVNSSRFLWWLVLTLIDIALIIIGVVETKRKKANEKI